MTEPEQNVVYQLKISINSPRAKIWRRVLVPAHFTLEQLHKVIKALMDWDGYHLHEFEVPVAAEASRTKRRSRRDGRRFGEVIDPEESLFPWIARSEIEDQAKAILKEIAPAAKSKFFYVYDMGDHWEHEILVEKILPAEPDGTYPVCIAGERNSPIEDSGGIWAYEMMLEILADPNHEDHKERKGWLREVFGVSKWDGDAFHQDAINKRLKKLFPKAAVTTRRTTRRRSPAPPLG